MTAYADLLERFAIATTGRTRRGQHGAVLAISGAPFGSLNVVFSPSADPSPGELAALADSENWDVPWSIQFPGVPGPLVTEVAARYGLTEVTRQPLMIRPAWQGLPTDPPVDSLSVRPVSADELGLYTATLAAGFELPDDAFSWLNVPTATEVEGVTYDLVELGGVPVGTGMTAVSGDLTGIFNVSTLPRYRRRGYGRAVIMEMIRAGFAAHAPTAYLVASEMGERVYEAAGFRTAQYLTIITAPS